MKQFTPILKRINKRLNLPQPTKSRIILEIACDLEDAYNFYLEKGMSEEDAIKKSGEKFDLTGEALDELVIVHQTLFRKFLDKIAGQTQSLWERIILCFVFLIIVVLSAQTFIFTPFFLHASKFVWPSLGIFFSVIILSLPKFFYLYIKKDHQLAKLYKGLHSILFLGVINLSIGVFGYLKELYSAGVSGLFFISYLGFLVNWHVPGSDNNLVNITQWMIKSSSLVMFCILVTIFTSAIWFFLLNKITKIEQAESMYLLQ
ncbi:hypothetical protein H8E88_15190 [candidate division KSB1 bacterium]|nr:hypothetical protein [candidate division KSB1 bacterium]MBL7092775.1 hypothetical protein [candidate division KSB1 bacterium]